MQPHLYLEPGASETVIHGLDLERLTSRLLTFQDVEPFPVTVHVQAADSRVEAAVSNGSARSLLGCSIVVSGRAYPLGDIAAGATVRKTFDVSEVTAGDAIAAGGDRRRAALLSAVEGDQGPRAGPARLVGWMDGPALPLWITDARAAAGRPGLALVSVESE